MKNENEYNEYDIIDAQSIEELSTLVDLAVKANWRLYGNIIIHNDGQEIHYLQATVRSAELISKQVIAAQP